MLGAEWRPMLQQQILRDANEGQGTAFISMLALQGTVPILISNQSARLFSYETSGNDGKNSHLYCNTSFPAMPKNFP